MGRAGKGYNLELMFCQNCGSQVGTGAQFCSRCGASQRIEAGTGAGGQVTTAPPPYLPVSSGKAEISRWIGQGWELVKSDLGNFVLMTVVMMVVNGAVPVILQGSLYAGFQGACKKKLRTPRQLLRQRPHIRQRVRIIEVA